MIKLINFTFVCILTVLYNQKIDLENLKFDTTVSEIVKSNKNLVKHQDTYYGLMSYRTNDLKDFTFGNVLFSKYEFPNGYDTDYND